MRNLLKQIIFYFTCLSAAGVIGSGCAAKWSPDIESTATPPQWVDQSGVAQAAYVASIQGFKQTGTTMANVLQYIVFGNRAAENAIQHPVAVAIGKDEQIAIADPGCACVHLFAPSE